MTSKETLLKERSQLNRTLNQFREMLPGSFINRKLTCGNPTCACMREGKLHTAYQLTYRYKGKTRSKMIPKDYTDMVQAKVNLQKRFKEIVERIQEINLELLLMELKK